MARLRQLRVEKQGVFGVDNNAAAMRPPPGSAQDDDYLPRDSNAMFVCLASTTYKEGYTHRLIHGRGGLPS